MIPAKITRYVTGELLKVFLITLTSFTLMMLLAGVVQEGLRQSLGLEAVLRLVPYSLPNAMVYSIPGTLLFSTCSVFGRMASANEFVAIKALGISPLVVMRPAFVLAFLLSLVTVWFVDLAFSWGHQGVQRVVMDSVVDIAYSVLKAQRSYNAMQFSITVTDVDGQRLLNPTIVVHQSNGKTLTMTAREAKLESTSEVGTLKLSLTNGEIDSGDKNRFVFLDTFEQPLSVVPQKVDLNSASQPSHMPMRYIATAQQEQRQEIRHMEQELSVDCAFGLLTGNLEKLGEPATAEWFQRLGQEQGRLYKLEAEPHRRWATGFSCLAFVLVGVPLAVLMRNADFMTTFGVCFLPILLLYYPIFALGLDRAKNGEMPPYFVWTGDVICAVIGIWFIRRAMRY